MQAKHPMTERVRSEIRMFSKNRKDISPVIENYSLKDEDLTNCIIKTFNRVGDDLTNINFAKSVIGEEGKITNLCGCNFMNSNFSDVVFLGTIWFRRANLRNCNFTRAFMPNVEYQYADIRNIRVCSAVMRIGSDEGMGALADISFFEQLKQAWNIFKKE